jgi:acylphosphatase
MSQGPSEEHSPVRLRVIVGGRVQGVFFRDFVRRQAQARDIVGYARNLADGRSVEVVAEGPEEKLQELLAALHHGPPRAKVEEVEVHWDAATGWFSRFHIC